MRDSRHVPLDRYDRVMATLEQRVERLEAEIQELRHADVTAGLQAQAYGLSLVRSEVAEIRANMATKDDVAALGAKLDAILVRLDVRG